MSKFTVQAEELSQALNLVLSSVETKTTIPILEFVLFESDGKTLKLTGTDIDTYISLNIEADSALLGFCVQAKKLRDLVSLMDGEIDVLAETEIIVQSGMSIYRLPQREKSEFPQIERASKSSGKMGGALFSEMVRAAAIAVSSNPNDTEVSKTICFAAKDGTLSVVGCDQKRLALAQTPTDSEFYAVMPLRAALSLAAFADQSGMVEIFSSDNLFTLESERGQAGARLSAIRWPNWELIIPKSHEHEIELEPSVLTPAIKRAILTTDSVLCGLKFTLSKKQAVVTTRTPDGSGQESFAIECPSLNGDEFIIRIPGKQILDLFKVCKGQVLWELEAPQKPVSFKPKESLAFDFQYIVMPIRVDAL